VEARAGRRIVFRVPSDHSEIMNERGGRDLLVERILGIRYPQSAPNVRRLLIEG